MTGEEHRAQIRLPNGFEYREAEVGNTAWLKVRLAPSCLNTATPTRSSTPSTGVTDRGEPALLYDRVREQMSGIAHNTQWIPMRCWYPNRL